MSSALRSDDVPPWGVVDSHETPFRLADLRAGLQAREAGRRPPPLVAGTRDAAILILVFDGPDGAEVVLIERSHHTGTHRGHIAFPGGVVHEGEPLRTAALRETEEEIGLHPDAVDVITALDGQAIWTGFVIWPFVGGLATPPALVADLHEVARVFTTPLTSLLADGAYWEETYGGGDRQLPFFAVPGGTAWGTTGQLLVDILAACVRGRAQEKENHD